MSPSPSVFVIMHVYTFMRLCLFYARITVVLVLSVLFICVCVCVCVRALALQTLRGPAFRRWVGHLCEFHFQFLTATPCFLSAPENRVTVVENLALAANISNPCSYRACLN